MTLAQKVSELLTKPERRRASVLLVLMLIGMALETIGVGVIIPVVALLMKGDFSSSYPRLRPMLDWLGNPTQRQLVTIGMLGLVGIYLIKSVFLAYLSWCQNKFASDVRVEMSQRLFTSYLRQPYTFHLQRNSAQMMRSITEDVGLFGTLIIHFANLVTEGLVLCGVAGLLLSVEPAGALIVVLVLGAAAAAFHFSTRAKIAKWGIARQHHEGLRIQHLQQGLGGAKDVKLLGRETDFLEQYKFHNIESAHVGHLQSTIGSLPRLWLELLAVMGLAALVITMLARHRDMNTVMPTLGLFAVAAFRLMPSVNRILAATQAFRYARPVIDSLYEELKLTSPKPTSMRVGDASFSADIRLSKVRFAYEGAPTPALTGVSIVIKKGQAVGFIGPTGSGKSTLVDVILGLLTPESGKIEVDGVDIQKDLRGWQDQIGYVAQAIYLTDDTLRRNIAFGLSDSDIDDIAVRRAINAAQLEDFIDGLPLGLETVVGERGIRLSGGQRQRIGIARALYHDPAVLVFDEATSALDVATEHEFMKAVQSLRGTKTVLIVAHRLSTVEQCDCLFRLVQGEVTQQGTPAEVLSAQRAT